VRIGGVTEEVRSLLVSGTGGVIADFGSGTLRSGSFAASSTELNVRYAGSYFRGGYPDYELHLQNATADGTPCAVTLAYEAEMAPERRGFANEQMQHFVVYRLRGRGTVQIGTDTYDVTGHGYYEHLLGTLGWQEALFGEAELPGFINGWNWYWAPLLGTDGVAVQAAGMVIEDEDLPYLALCTPDAAVTHFSTGTTQVLEEREFDGHRYAHKLRFSDRNEAGTVDLIVTRNHVGAQRIVKPGPAGSRFVFITGLAEFEGSATIGDVDYDLGGAAFGSVFRLAESRLLRRFRTLPTAVRVPLGRMLRALSGMRQR
jgi:hypothetical protein